MLAVCLALLAVEPRFLAPLRNSLFDTYQRLAPRERATAPAIVVAIDDASLDARGQWPWSRGVVAELVRRLAQAGALVVGLDVLFAEPDRSVAGADAELAQALGESPTVLAVVGLPDADRRFRHPPQVPPLRVSEGAGGRLPLYRGHLQSIPAIDQAAAARGLISVDAREGVIRRVNLLGRIGGVTVPGFAVEMLRVATGGAGLELAALGADEAALRIADVAIPLRADGGFWIHYGRHDAERFVSAEAVLAGRMPADLVRDKLVLVGVMASGLHDIHPSPLGERIAGVELHAQVLEQVFDGRFLRRPAWTLWLEAALLLAAGLLCVILMSRVSVWASVVLLAAAVGAFAGAGIAAFRAGWLLDVATPALGVIIVFGTVLSALFAEADRQRRALREAQARVEGELHAAHRIQSGLLPSPQALFAGEERFQLAAVLEPARTVGGDFYDCFMVDSNRLFFIIADVSGKGLPASLFMALAKSLIKSIALRTGDDPGAILTRANGEIARDNPESLFVTAFVGILDARIGALAFSNAGHEPPLARKPDGTLEPVEHSGGPPLCVMPDFEYPTEHRRMLSGEWLCAVTDGVTEAMNPHNAAYGASRLKALLGGLPADIDAAGVIDVLRADVQRFAGAGEASDDLTAMCLRWNGAGAFTLETRADGDELADLDV